MRDIKEVRQKIMKALGIKHRASWIARLNGTIEPRVSEAKAIEEIFAEYGITDIWGGEE
jgi:predicted transcriptional regulator